MDKKFTAQLHIHYDNECNFLDKNVSSNLTKSFLLVNYRARRFTKLKKTNLLLKL